MRLCLADFYCSLALISGNRCSLIDAEMGQGKGVIFGKMYRRCVAMTRKARGRTQ